jgi:NAD(P)H dehydrogenase (quinone)
MVKKNLQNTCGTGFQNEQSKGDKCMKTLVVFYSLYGHVARMAEAVAEGAGSVKGVEVTIKMVPETLPSEVIEKMGATQPRQELSTTYPLCEPNELAEYDLLLFGTPTRFGNMCGQMRQFLDATGKLWANGSLVGKLAGVFTSTNTQHGGQESTILTTMNTLLHLGMIIGGLPYTFEGQSRMDEITGCSPYGASTIAGADGSRLPSENELDGARFQGRYLAEIGAKLFS